MSVHLFNKSVLIAFSVLLAGPVCMATLPKAGEERKEEEKKSPVPAEDSDEDEEILALWCELFPSHERFLEQAVLQGTDRMEPSAQAEPAERLESKAELVVEAQSAMPETGVGIGPSMPRIDLWSSRAGKLLRRAWANQERARLIRERKERSLVATLTPQEMAAQQAALAADRAAQGLPPTRRTLF